MLVQCATQEIKLLLVTVKRVLCVSWMKKGIAELGYLAGTRYRKMLGYLRPCRWKKKRNRTKFLQFRQLLCLSACCACHVRRVKSPCHGGPIIETTLWLCREIVLVREEIFVYQLQETNERNWLWISRSGLSSLSLLTGSKTESKPLFWIL